MANYTLNPASITAQGNAMPTFNNQAQYVQPTALAGSFPMSMPSVASVANGGNLSQYSGLIGSALGFVGGILDRNAARKEAAKERDWNEAMMDKQNDWSLNMWNKTNEYNSPVEQIARLREAGLNPLYYGLDGTSANGLESAQPLGYQRAQIENMTNPLQQGLEGYISAKSLQKDIELKNTQIDKIKADTANIGLDTEFKDKTMDARVEAENLGNMLTKENIEKIKKEKRQVEANIEKLIAETKSENERAGLIVAQKMLAKASEKEIVELLPYKRLLMEAQTTAQKAAAAASFAHEAYERKLLDSGYIDKMTERMDAEIARLKTAKEREEAIAAREKWITSIKTGELLQSDNEFVQGVYDVILNYPLKTLSTISTVLDGFSPALLLAGAGKALGAFNSKGKGRATNLVDSSGNPMLTTDYTFNY